MADSINLMLDELINDIKWLIELGLRTARHTDLSQVWKLKVKYFEH